MQSEAIKPGDGSVGILHARSKADSLTLTDWNIMILTAHSRLALTVVLAAPAEVRPMDFHHLSSPHTSTLDYP